MAGKIPCENCGKLFDPRGMKWHVEKKHGDSYTKQPASKSKPLNLVEEMGKGVRAAVAKAVKPKPEFWNRLDLLEAFENKFTEIISPKPKAPGRVRDVEDYIESYKSMGKNAEDLKLQLVRAKDENAKLKEQLQGNNNANNNASSAPSVNVEAEKKYLRDMAMLRGYGSQMKGLYSNNGGQDQAVDEEDKEINRMMKRVTLFAMINKMGSDGELKTFQRFMQMMPKGDDWGGVLEKMGMLDKLAEGKAKYMKTGEVDVFEKGQHLIDGIGKVISGPILEPIGQAVSDKIRREPSGNAPQNTGMASQGQGLTPAGPQEYPELEGPAPAPETQLDIPDRPGEFIDDRGHTIIDDQPREAPTGEIQAAVPLNPTENLPDSNTRILPMASPDYDPFGLKSGPIKLKEDKNAKTNKSPS